MQIWQIITCTITYTKITCVLLDDQMSTCLHARKSLKLLWMLLHLIQPYRKCLTAVTVCLRREKLHLACFPHLDYTKNNAVRLQANGDIGNYKCYIYSQKFTQLPLLTNFQFLCIIHVTFANLSSSDNNTTNTIKIHAQYYLKN